MSRVTLAEAQARLPDLIAGLSLGEEVQITRDDRPIARLVGEAHPQRRPRVPGSAVGKLVIVAEDEAHLEDFKDYMP